MTTQTNQDGSGCDAVTKPVNPETVNFGYAETSPAIHIETQPIS